jgi:hypothetical protein
MTRAFVILLALLPLDAADFPLTSLDRLEVPTGVAVLTSYQGKSALKLTDKNAGPNDSIAILKGIKFHDGIIDVELSGVPAQNADPAARGFIGIAFRVQPDSRHSEVIYIRPTNGRATDQLRRNHSTQYISPPDWTWQRLRQETPGIYESYVDLQPGEWTRMRIVVKGRDASLYIGSAEQPCLLVHDLKLGDVTGGVALWSGSGTEAYFRNLTITGDK